jgi:DNA-binding NarL/FixJ family response regulator
MTGTKVRILLADEQSLFRQAVKLVLESEADLEVVAEARDGVGAVARAEKTHPDVALIDVDLPNGDGIRAAAMIKERVPGCRVLVLAGEESERTLIDALEAGASGYLTKDSPLSELIGATRAVNQGELMIPLRMMSSLITRLLVARREQHQALLQVSSLTRREREILALLSSGAGNDLIAQRLVISPETARTHIQNLLSKLGVHSRLEAAAFVARHGIVRDLMSEWAISAGTTRRQPSPREPGVGEPDETPSLQRSPAATGS